MVNMDISDLVIIGGNVMPEIEKLQWCDICGSKMVQGGVKRDILSRTDRVTVECKRCNKWTWEEE